MAEVKPVCGAEKPQVCVRHVVPEDQRPCSFLEFIETEGNSRIFLDESHSGH